jgi:large subunit ribosomal protein L18
MMAADTSARRRAARLRRHARVRKRLAGTPDRPRLSVYRSLQHIYAQLIDDAGGHTLASASSREPAIAETAAGHKKTERAKVVGQMIAERARLLGIDEVVFDRGGYRYHGRVRALADAAREAGLQF